MAGCNPSPQIDDDPQWANSIFHSGNLPPNVKQIEDMDLGCKPLRPTDDPTPSLEGYWDRDDVNGYLYPKQLDDQVLLNYTAPFYDEQFGVSGKIYTTAGYMMGPGNQLIYSIDSVRMAFNTGGRNSVYIHTNHIRGTQANSWMLNTLSPTNSPTTPVYTFYTDTDTVMYRHEANGLAFAGAGANLFVLNANGSIQLPNIPATAADGTVPVLARNAATGIIEQRVLTELHTHANKTLLDLLSDIGPGELAYGGILVFDASDYYTTTEIDTAHATLLANINTRSLTTHNHNLADLTERSYNSLTDQPDLTDLHSHPNKATLDVIPDYAPATQDDIMVRDGGGIAWKALSAVTSGHWLRDAVGVPFLYPTVTTDELHIDVIEEYVLNNGILIGDVLTVDQLNSRVGVGIPVPIYDLDVAGAGRFGDTTPGQSLIGYGIIINNNGSSLAIGDFKVKAVTYDAITVDASEDSMLLMSNALGKVGFFGEVPTVQSTGWTITNHVVTKVFDADVTTIDEICDVLSELITELKLKGILGGV